MESKFNQIFHTLPDTLSSSLGSWNMDTKDYCAALTSSRLSRWNVMTPRDRHLFLTTIEEKKNQNTDPEHIPKVINVSISCLCLNEKKPEVLCMR